MAKPVTPLLTVDCIAFDPRGRVMLIRRGSPPFKGDYALPGGFVDLDETVEDAGRRELLEETGLKADRLFMVGVYSKPGRDPRGPTVSVAFATVFKRANRPKAGDDAAHAAWVANWRKADLAFDHDVIVADAFRSMRRRRLVAPAR